MPHTLSSTYLDCCEDLIRNIRSQREIISTVAELFSRSILAGRVVHLFGSGHSRMMVEEMWPRYGSFPGFNPIVELSLSYYNPVVGANGLRQVMFIENTPGLASKILANYCLSDKDSALVISTSGCNIVTIEVAEQLQKQGIKVVALLSRRHMEASTSNDPRGKKIEDFADYVLDNGAPVGDAMVAIEGHPYPVAPGSTVGGAMMVNAIKAEVAQLLVSEGHPLKIITGSAIAGKEARSVFESACDEHAKFLSRLYQKA